MRNDNPMIKLDFYVARGNGLKAVSGGVMKIGEPVAFNFSSNEDGFITIVDIQPGGDIVILYPNEINADNKIAAGKLYSVPSKDDNFKIIVSEPAGKDTVAAFFTKKKVDWLDRKMLDGEGLWTVKDKEKIGMTRGLKVVSAGLKSSDWKSNIYEINVEK